MSDSDTSARSASSAVLRYGLAVASVAAALIATLLLGPDALVTPIFFLAIILTAWIAGFGPGLVAALLATLVIPYFFLPPVYSVRFDVHELPHLIVFFISALLISWWSAVRRRAETSLRRARDEMDAKVQDRTADLSRSNEQLQAEIAERKRAEEVLQVQTVELRNHAQLLELAHDAILVRDLASKIIFWNRGAERMYGWTREEARGEVTHTFLQTKFPRSFEETEAELSDDGYWEGEIVHTTRDGSRLVVASRQVLQRDQSGNPVAILEINNDITDRKRAEESVREQASLLNLTHDTIFVRGINDAITYWNHGAEELYGWKKEEAIGRISHQLLQTIFPAPIEAINEELLDSGRWQGEITHTKRDGTQVVVASRWSLKRDEQGRPVAVLETNNDITSRKLGEEKLRRSESYLAEAQRLSHTGSVGWSVLSGEIYWSEETYQIFEYDQTAKPTLELVMQRVHPDDRAFVQQTMDGAFNEGTNFDIEHRLLMPDDAVKHLHVLGHASRDSSGNLEVVGAVMDITATKQAEEAQRRSEEQWRDVFENNPTMYFMVDAGGKVLAVNPFGAQQLGYTVNDLIGQPVLSVFEESDRETVQTNLAICLEQLGLAKSWEARKVRRDGKVLWVRETAKAVPRVEGPIVLIACEDMTEKKRAEEALRKAQEELAHVTRVMTMGELVASIAHEVNQPLGAIVTSGHACVRLLSREVPDIDKSLETIGRMIKDGMRASEVIKRIRAILHKTPTEKAPLNINETIQEVIALVSSDVLRSKVEMRAELAPDLPPVAGDRIQLQQVILNLILNGKDAMSGVKSNPRELLITSRKSKAGELVVAVRDSGHGLDPADAERIFDPFFTTKAEGMGLGLSISRNIIEAHGGALWATPNEDRGATIQFTLPPSGT